jgi:D-glycero-alpha-D-manno-heptose-7-phosphate kinase
MIIAKAPLRISIGGGGTDLPSYYERFESTFISAAIDKYIYISLHPIFIEELIIKYSELERVKDVEQIRHPIVREALKLTGLTRALEISSFADIPSGTGLGSSGTFTVALLKALYTYRMQAHSPLSIAEDACRIEIEKLGAPIGKQDQYIASVGGLTRFHIDREGKVTSHPLEMQPHDLVDLQEHLLLFFTGYSRSANDILREQDDAVKGKAAPANNGEAEKLSHEMLENLHFTNELGLKIGTSLEKGEIDEFGRLMNVHWEHKKKRSKNMSSGPIDQHYELAMKNGAIGGKLIGAGGGGFLMFLADDKRRLRKAMREAGLKDVPFRFDTLGAQVVLRD